MPKKKQVPFQSTTPGKFIPRDDPPSTSVFRSGTNDNRFNSRMAELLASSSSSSTTVNNENESIPPTSSDDPTLLTSPEMTNVDQAPVHSRLFHRRIVTMIETLKRRGGNNEATSPSRLTPSHLESKSQPITFGQLRQATTTSSPPPPKSIIVHESVPSSKVLSARSYTDLVHSNDTRSDLTPVSKTKLSLKHQTNKERLHYSPSLENLLEQQNVVPRMKEQDETKTDEQQQQQSKSPLTVDEILATYYSKGKVPTTTDTQTNSYPDSTASFYIHPSSLGWKPPQNNHHIPPPPLLLNEQNRNRPPPPSYSSSVATGHRPSPPTANNLAQHLIRSPTPSSIREQVYTSPQITQPVLPGNSPLTFLTNTSVRPPPPRYISPTHSIERSHSAVSSMTRPNYPPANSPQAGFDPEFSRLLYGKDGGGKSRHQRQKRKSFSDPVKKSVEEAGRSVEKTHRRLANHLNKADTVKEEEETGSDSNEIDKREVNLLPRRTFQHQFDLTVRRPIVPPNPLLNRRIPTFLHVYSQASSSNDILLQWQLFSVSELESFDAMMTKLYKDENLTRIRFYENYRALLTSTKASKTLLNKVNLNDDNDEENSITTTAL